MEMIGRIGVLVAIALAAAGCSSTQPTSQTASDGTFEVTVSVPPGPHHAADALAIVATLTYQGSEKTVTIVGGDEGIVSFSFKQLDGPREMGGASLLMCSPPMSLARGTPATFRPAKVVGYGESDPLAGFYREWAADPEVHLPAGRWLVVATAKYWNAEYCMGAGQPHVITPAGLVVNVVA